MNFPFENDTSHIEKKLAVRSIQADRRSTAFLFFTIALSVCMVFSILLISKGVEEKYKNTQRNKAQIAILGVTDEQSEQLRQNPEVLWVGEYSAIGLFYTGDKISLDVTGTGQEAVYTLSGILNDTRESNGYFLYLSKELARNLAGNLFQVTAYTRLATDTIRSPVLLDTARQVIQGTSIVEEQINLTEYFAVMSGTIKKGIPLPVPLLAALTAFLVATIVYGVFYTKIVKNVQMFGQLRTIGMTQKQMKRMAGKEGRRYALMGIPLGLLSGGLIGFLGCPEGFLVKTAIRYALLIAVASFAAVTLAIFKPVRVAMNTSPIEGAKYLTYTGKMKRRSRAHRKLTPFRLAGINLQRNRQKAVLTLLMLGVSGALLLVTSTLARSIDPEKQADFKYYPVGTILVGIKNTVGSSFDSNTEPFGSARLQLEHNPLKDQTLLHAVEELADNDGRLEVNTIKQTIHNIQYRYSASIKALYLTSGILFVFGSISLLNMLMVDFQSRKREFGLFAAVGTTRKQLQHMLNWEIAGYLLGSLAISLTGGSLFSFLACHYLDSRNHCITLKLPWLFLLALLAVMVMTDLLFTTYAKAELKKPNILSAIKAE